MPHRNLISHKSENLIINFIKLTITFLLKSLTNKRFCIHIQVNITKHSARPLRIAKVELGDRSSDVCINYKPIMGESRLDSHSDLSSARTRTQLGLGKSDLKVAKDGGTIEAGSAQNNVLNVLRAKLC